MDLRIRNGNLDFSSTPRVSRRHEDHLKNQKGTERHLCSIGWRFTEVLNGHICVSSNINDYTISEAIGKGLSCSMQMFLTIELFKNTAGT